MVISNVIGFPYLSYRAPPIIIAPLSLFGRNDDYLRRKGFGKNVAGFFTNSTFVPRSIVFSQTLLIYLFSSTHRPWFFATSCYLIKPPWNRHYFVATTTFGGKVSAKTLWLFYKHPTIAQHGRSFFAMLLIYRLLSSTHMPWFYHFLLSHQAALETLEFLLDCRRFLSTFVVSSLFVSCDPPVPAPLSSVLLLLS
jgi:hypothetical protein